MELSKPIGSADDIDQSRCGYDRDGLEDVEPSIDLFRRAAARGEIDGLERLLDDAADLINGQDRYGDTALAYDVGREIGSILRERGAAE